MSNLIELIERGGMHDFNVALPEDGAGLSYSEAWDYVESYLMVWHDIDEFWECRDLDQHDDFYSGFVNGAVWIATYDGDNECWDFDFMTYENYEEYSKRS